MSEPTDKKPSQEISRRKANKILAASGAAVTAGLMAPKDWSKPLSGWGVLPAHANGSQGMLNVSVANIEFDHEVGITECPQLLGTITLTQTTGMDAPISITVPSGVAVRNGGAAPSDPAITMTSVPNGGSTMVDVYFDCSTTTSFNGNLVFTLMVGTGTCTVTVNANIMDT